MEFVTTIELMNKTEEDSGGDEDEDVPGYKIWPNHSQNKNTIEREREQVERDRNRKIYIIDTGIENKQKIFFLISFLNFSAIKTNFQRIFNECVLPD